MAEHASKPIRRPPVSENGNVGLVYKDYDNSALQAAATATDGETDWSGWERWMRGHLDNEREAILDIVAEGMTAFVDQELVAVNRQLAELRSENLELKSMLADALRKVDDLTKRTAMAHHL
jgi:hypothetical protein